MAKANEVAVYGSVEQAALLLEGVAKIVEREPAATFADAGLRTSAESLRDLITRRLGEAGGRAP